MEDKNRVIISDHIKKNKSNIIPINEIISKDFFQINKNSMNDYNIINVIERIPNTEYIISMTYFTLFRFIRNEFSTFIKENLHPNTKYELYCSIDLLSYRFVAIDSDNNIINEISETVPMEPIVNIKNNEKTKRQYISLNYNYYINLLVKYIEQFINLKVDSQTPQFVFKTDKKVKIEISELDRYGWVIINVSHKYIDLPLSSENDFKNIRGERYDIVLTGDCLDDFKYKDLNFHLKIPDDLYNYLQNTEDNTEENNK